MRIVHLGREFEARQRLAEVGVQRGDHDEHERLAVAAKGELQQVGQLHHQRAIVSFLVAFGLAERGP